MRLCLFSVTTRISANNQQFLKVHGKSNWRCSPRKDAAGGQIASAFIWIDTYNQLVSDIAGTITTRVDGACQYFVSVER